MGFVHQLIRAEHWGVVPIQRWRCGEYLENYQKRAAGVICVYSDVIRLLHSVRSG